jgi:autotransporter-associated beta strand protein
VISGSGAVHIDNNWGSGAKKTIFTGNNTNTGTTYIDYGTLQLGDGTNEGKVGGAIVDAAILRFVEPGTTQKQYNNSVSYSGSGAIYNDGACNIYLPNIDSYFHSVYNDYIVHVQQDFDLTRQGPQPAGPFRIAQGSCNAFIDPL